MSSDSRDKDLLFGVMSVQLGLTSEAQISAYAETWLRDPSATLADQLEKDGVLAPEQRRLVEVMVERAIDASEGDAGRTLNALRVNQTAAERMLVPARSATDSRDEELEELSFEQFGRYRFGNPNATLDECKRGSPELPDHDRQI